MKYFRTIAKFQYTQKAKLTAPLLPAGNVDFLLLKPGRNTITRLPHDSNRSVLFTHRNQPRRVEVMNIKAIEEELAFVCESFEEFMTKFTNG